MVSGIIVGIVALPLAIAFAIQVGVVLAAFLFMRRMSEVTNVTAVTAEFESEVSDLQPGTEPGAPAGVAVYEINGPFFVGAADKFATRSVRSAAGRAF